MKNNLTLGPTSELALGVGLVPSLVVSDQTTLAGVVGGQPARGYSPPVGVLHAALEACSVIEGFDNRVAMNPGHSWFAT